MLGEVKTYQLIPLMTHDSPLFSLDSTFKKIYIFKNQINEFGISKKFCIFFTHYEICEHKFEVILALFANFECLCSNNEPFLNKVKAYYLRIYINLSLNPIKFWKLEAPSVFMRMIRVIPQSNVRIDTVL